MGTRIEPRLKLILMISRLREDMVRLSAQPDAAAPCPAVRRRMNQLSARLFKLQCMVVDTARLPVDAARIAPASDAAAQWHHVEPRRESHFDRRN